MLSLKKTLVVSSLALFIMCGINFIFGASTSYAVSGGCYFNTVAGPITGTGTCGVSGYGDYGTNDILPGRNDAGDNVIPSNVNTKAEFINFVLNRWGSNDTHTKIGAAFIMQTLRGHYDWPDAGNVNDWVKRMNSPDITVSRGSVNIIKTSWYDPGKHNTFFAPYSPGSRTAIIVKYRGVTYGVIETGCANLANDPTPLPPPPVIWKMNPNTDRGTSPVISGEAMTWTHSVTKADRANDDPTDNAVNWEIRQYTVDSQSDPDRTGSIVDSGTISAGKQNGWSNSWQKRATSQDNQVGKWVCQYIRIKPSERTTDGLVNSWLNADRKCIKVQSSRPPSSGNFDPTVLLDSDVVEPNANYNFDNVSVTGGSIPYASELARAKPTVPYQLARLIYLPGASTFSQTTSDTPPSCAFYGQSDPRYCNASFRSGDVNATRGVQLTYGEAFPDNLPSGAKVCYAMAVEQPPSVETHTYQQSVRTGTDRHGNPIYELRTFSDRYYSDQGHNHAGDVIPPVPRKWKYDTDCVMVGKRPKVQVQGNDLRVRGESQTKVTHYNGSYYGSWIEYGAFTTKEDNAPASGAGYRDGSPSDLYSRLTWSRLTFANTNSSQPNTYGYFTGIPPSPPLVAYYDEQTSSGTSSWPGSLAGGKYRTGSVTVGGNNDNLTKDRTTILYSTGTVTIDSNISYKNDGYHSFDEIPQVVIVAQNINITSNVSRIDAWLIAYGDISDKTRGNINTCSDGPPVSARTSTACNTPLVVNGPVVANGLYLNRTGPIAYDPGAAAETFRLRPDAYLWAAARQKSTGAARTVDIVELPPRF